jgi:hypothetical protein
MSTTTIDRIGALLAKAEATDNEHERDAFMSKAQEMSTLCQIDLEMARNRQADKTKREAPVKEYAHLLDHEIKTLRQHFVDLAYHCANNNNVKMLYWPNSKTLAVNLFGFPSDIEVMRLLFTSLSVQMIAAADAYIKTKAYKGDTYTTEDGWGYYIQKPVDARVARNQFYQAFKSEVGKRLREARKAVEDSNVQTDSGDTTTGALVLVSRTREVSDFFQANSGKVSHASSNARIHRGGNAGAAGAAAGAAARLSSSKGIGSRAGAIG